MSKVTRGKGLLEPWLAQMRAQKAEDLIPDTLRSGRILDIGCGSYPYFLSHTSFKEKIAIDQNPLVDPPEDIEWHTLDLNQDPELPFDSSFFSVVTMLAVIEHLNPSGLVQLFQETRRVLNPGGQVILTTPASWSDRLLRFMAFIGLVSKEEIEEHVFPYTMPLLGWYFGAAGFERDKVNFGYFELGLNMWAVAER